LKFSLLGVRRVVTFKWTDVSEARTASIRAMNRIQHDYKALHIEHFKLHTRRHENLKSHKSKSKDASLNLNLYDEILRFREYEDGCHVLRCILSAYQEKVPARNAIYAHAHDFAASDEMLLAILKAFNNQM
jgi:hypothetical protein